MSFQPVPQRVLPYAPLHSFTVRRGRLTCGQQQALERLWPAYGLRVDGAPADLVQLFGRDAPVVLDIGSGMGEATALAAAADQGRNVLAVEVHTPGLAALLRQVADLDLSNVRVADGDARLLLSSTLVRAALEEVRIWFPDPWPKARHAKRRLITDTFLDLLATRVRAGGLLSVATDWPAYASNIEASVLGHPAWELISRERPGWRPVTKFEAAGRLAGRPARDLLARRV